MDLLDLMVKIGVDDQASSKVDSLAGKITGTLGKAAGLAAKGVAAGVAAVTAATGAITKSSLDAYAAYEQNVGGIQKLFGNMGQTLQDYAAMNGATVEEVSSKWQALEDAQNKVFSNAANAYKTAGVSANQYMEQVTGFSAALITSLGNDTQKAAQYADIAMTNMSDNANTFGTDIESIQWAYQGFAKSNYTMLDNLKLGYGGTKEEMQRLIADASKMTDVQKKLGVTVDGTSMSFDNIVAAIDVMQTSMQISGITAEQAAELVASGAMTEEEAFMAMGTTAREAATTIEGSVNSMKAAWQNWLTGLGDDGADMSQLTDELVESFETAAGNVIPRVGVIVGTLIGEIPGLVAQVGPALVDGMGQIGEQAESALRDALSGNDFAIGALDGIEAALQTVADFGTRAADGVGQLAEKLDGMGALDAASTVLQAVGEFIEHIADQAGEYLMPVLESAADALNEFFNAVSEAQVWLQPLADFLGDVLVAALQIVVAAFIAAVDVVTLVINVVTEFVNFLMGVPASVQSFVDQVGAFFGQLPGLIGGFLASVVSAIGSWVSQTISQGIQAGSQFLSNVGNFFAQLPGNVGNFLSSVISTVGGWVSDMGSKAAEAASNFGSNLLDGLWGLVGSAQEAGSAIVQGVIDGITGMISAAGDAIGSVVDTIASYLPHSPAKRGAFSGKGWTPYSGRAIVHGLAQGIAELADEPVDAMAAVMDGVSATTAVMQAATSTGTAPWLALASSSDRGRTINQTFNTKVVRADSDLYAAAPIIYRNAVREASFA